MLGLKKKKYDFIFSIGNSCESSQRLRKNGLQYMSMPFDWVTGSSFPEKVHMLCNGFENFINKEDFEFYPEGKSETGCICYFNNKNNFFFPHDFPHDKPFSEGYEIVKSKYDRRIERFYNFIEKSNKVLFVIKLYAYERMTAEDLKWASDRFSEKFGKDKIDLVVFQDDPSAQRNQYKYNQVSKNVTLIEFDAFDEDNTEKDGKFGNEKQLDALLKKYNLTFYGKYILQEQYKYIGQGLLYLSYKKQLNIYFLRSLPFALFRMKVRFLSLKIEIGVGRIKKGKF